MKLIVDKSKCILCKKCDDVVSGFNKCANGVFISELSYEREDVKESIKELIKRCPAGAIKLTPEPKGFMPKH